MKPSSKMQKSPSGKLRGSSARAYAAAPILAIMLSLLVACAAQVPQKPAPVPVVPPQSAENKSAAALVAPLQDGRQGFVINETVRMDEASRSDFEAAVALFNEGAYDKAIELFKKVVAQSPGVTAPYIDLGMAYQQINKPELAEAQFKTALELVPGHPVASNQYGLLFRKSGRFDEARKMYEEALARFPDYYPLNRNLGILCDIYLDDLQCALTQYQTYSQAMPEDNKVKIWIADVKGRLGTK